MTLQKAKIVLTIFIFIIIKFKKLRVRKITLINYSHIFLKLVLKFLPPLSRLPSSCLASGGFWDWSMLSMERIAAANEWKKNRQQLNTTRKTKLCKQEYYKKINFNTIPPFLLTKLVSPKNAWIWRSISCGNVISLIINGDRARMEINGARIYKN